MTSTSLLVTLPQMVDLALGSPEIGAVNFNLLSAALQVIIQQMKLGEFVVDFRGPEAERIQGLLATAKPGMNLKITENTEPALNKTEEQIGHIEPRRNSKEEPQAGAIRTNEKVVVVEQGDAKKIGHLPHIVVGVSQDLFIQINEDVEHLKNQMAEILELPSNDTVIEAIKAHGHDKVTPVIDMWHALNISKRLESTETAMDKVAGMFEDLVQDITSSLQKEEQHKEQEKERRPSLFGEFVNRLEAVEQKLSELKTPEKKDADEDAGLMTLTDVIECVEELKNRIKSMEQDFATLTKGAKGKTLLELFKEIEDVKGKLLSGEVKTAAAPAEQEREAEAEIDNQLAEKVAEFENMINNLDETLSGRIVTLQDHMLAIEKELGTILENQNTKAEAVSDAASLSDMFNKFLKIQDDLDALHKITDRLTEDFSERAMLMDSLVERIELLKTTKADREDLEDALADKADMTQVNRKVSTIQFQTAYEDLTKNIEDTMAKLTQQEELWVKTLDELQGTIGEKLDKTEFDPLKDFVNKKIKSLQQRLKALLAMKQEQEAAGTKNKLLKNVNCISCDKEVVMQKENMFGTFPNPPVLPASRTIKPYITYELDAVRKQQRMLPQGRNLNFLEKAMQERKEVKKERPQSEKAIPSGHMCNRYCGGSHTMTLPQQRVAHVGHFLTQWGPHAVPLDEGQIMGSDGQMYKAREGGEESPKSPKSPKPEDIRRISAQIQTDDSKEKIQRMSSSLEPSKRRKSGSKQELKEEVKAESEIVTTSKPSSRSSLKKRGSSVKGGRKPSKGSKEVVAVEEVAPSTEELAPVEEKSTTEEEPPIVEEERVESEEIPENVLPESPEELAPE